MDSEMFICATYVDYSIFALQMDSQKGTFTIHRYLNALCVKKYYSQIVDSTIHETFF